VFFPGERLDAQTLGAFLADGLLRGFRTHVADVTGVIGPGAGRFMRSFQLCLLCNLEASALYEAAPLKLS
jgi:hypothetical protein